ncbi:predicted protein [Uncinocarpus reesii 1704]|uniref:Pheromone alpha factor receptor n=1 Tax=Uncinocarpus reesii (strain UAMH 1704) TaxID=336963 RepID=C4JL18_UNCRE|nr:uncharacterized protein UREG_00233 [Uncinocarpus reesii 1704]EEP75387.1 predicted protein [Uncinocarpus reesii 1704]
MGFNPFTQEFYIRHINGNEITTSLAKVDFYMQDNAKQCISFGAQLGASLMMLIVLFLLTPPDKRRSPVFWLNSAALLLNSGHMLCSSLFYTSGFAYAYALLASDYSQVPVSSYANSILGTILIGLLVICVEASLLFQTQVLCSTFRSLYRYTLLGVSMLLVLVTVGFRLAQTVENCKVTIGLKSFETFIWLQSATNILTTTSICYFSAIFVAKLGFAINTRRELGLTGFGAMQVIFIMFCQTMTVPAIFSILQYFVEPAEMSPLSLTLVTLSLPLSSMWAAQAAKNGFENKGASDPRPLFARGFSEATHGLGTQPSMAATLVPSRTLTTDQLDKLYPELEAGEIHVERDFTISSDKMK